MPNNKQNVSTTRGVKGGYAFRAPIGTTGAPTKTNYKTWGRTIPSGWVCLGYIPEDGLTEAVSFESTTTLPDINLEALDTSNGSSTETMAFGLMEVAAAALAVEYGTNNVTDADGTVEVRHNWGEYEEHSQYVFLLLLKDDRPWVKYVPDAKVTEIGDITLNKTTAAQREVTLTYFPDDTGAGCYDWIESTETTETTETPGSGS